MHRRTRIVCTLGPATDKPGVLEQVLKAGMNVARINLSHGAGEEHLGRIARVRDLARDLPRPVAILADLPGPKLRVAQSKPVTLTTGASVVMGLDAGADIVLAEADVYRHLQAGQRVLFDDGRLQARVVEAGPNAAVLEVTVGGTLLSKKGINLPDTDLRIAPLTAADAVALATVAKAGIDWLALSFVRHPEDAAAVREAARWQGLFVPVLAKIERPEAVNEAPAIVDAFDGIMVARGDLGVEIPLEEVPHVQKRLIALARMAGKPVITATDMLDSMRTNPRPTRAEASDVANAVYDGTDAVMLSGETSVGQYPVEAVAYMDRIVRQAEAHQIDDGPRHIDVPRADLDDHLTHITCTLAAAAQARAIVVPTVTGRTVQHLVRHRPRADIVAPCEDAGIRRVLALVWGVQAIPFTVAVSDAADLLDAAVGSAFAQGAVAEGDRIVVLSGNPIESGVRLPTLRVVRVGPGGVSREP